jgi:hypothetical protein
VFSRGANIHDVTETADVELLAAIDYLIFELDHESAEGVELELLARTIDGASGIGLGPLVAGATESPWFGLRARLERLADLQLARVVKGLADWNDRLYVVITPAGYDAIRGRHRER